MADKKIEKALYGPSMTEVALGAVLGLIAGVLAAGIYLVFKPVSTVKEMPKDDKVVRGMVYFIPGNESNAKSKNWQAKQKLMVANPSFTVDLVEDELNAWANTLSGPPSAPAAPAKGAPAPKAGEAPKPAGDGIFNPGKPNFRIVDGRLQIGTKVLLNWYGLTYETMVITTGTFTKSGDVFVYSPSTLYLGSCPVHLLPALAGPLMNHLVSKEKVPDEIRSAWAKVDVVTIENGALKLVAQ